jgi:hypothetical protein
MQKTRHPWLLSCLLFGGAISVWANADLTRIQAQIEQLQRDIASEKQMLKADQARRKSWEGSSKGQLEEMRTQARRARFEADSLARVRQTLGNPTLTQAFEQKRLQAESERFAARIADQSDAVLEKMRRGELPVYVERKERDLKDLSRGLRTGVIPTDQGLGKLLDHLSEIIDWGRRVEASAGPYTALDGRPMDGFYVRAGGFFEAFVSKDGSHGAQRFKNEAGWQWKEAMPADRRDNLLKVAMMLQAQQEPGFVPLSFGVAAGGEP